MKIAFHSDRLCIRGTSVAMYDYANHNELLLKNTSVIITKKGEKHDKLGLERFQSRFQVLFYENKNQLETILQEQKCDILYCIKYGKNDGIFSTTIKTVIHCVFDMTEPHGNVYAGVSDALAKKFGRTLSVPHMIGLKPSETGENLREKFSIPSDAIVFGRYGGLDTFNLQFCWETIIFLINSRSDIYFLLNNTPKFYNHKQIIYTDAITTEKEKSAFISTCDAHIECGNLGHSFGLAIGEFSVNNKPIIAYKVPNLWNKAHIEILGDKALYFSNQSEFYKILANFRPADYRNKNNNCYTEYTPEKVMKIFKAVFID